MSWTTPRTWVTGEYPSASLLNTHIRDDLDAAAGAGKAACNVYRSTNQSISNGTFTAITFDSERFDTQGLHSTSVNTSRITIPTGWGGLWHIGGSIEFAGSGTGIVLAAVYLNGNTATQLARQAVPNHSGAGITVSPSGIYRLSAGDYIELAAYQTSGGSLNALAAINYSPVFWAVWIGA